MSAVQRFEIPFVILVCAVQGFPREASAHSPVLGPIRHGYISISKSFIGIDTTANNTRTVTFTIHWGIAENVNEVEEVEYSLTCSGTATCTSQSGAFIMSTTNPSDEVTVTYTTGASGAGSVLMTAMAASGSEAESEIVVQLPAPLPNGAPIVGVDVVQRLPRSDCLITSAGPAGAYQCGDLVVAHTMPAYKTMNEDRRLTLLYSSAAATVQQTLAVHVTIPSGMQVPDTIRVALWIDTLEWNFKYLGSSFASGEKRRLSLSFDASSLTFGTGLYSYKLRVSNYYGTTAFHADTTHGEIVAVDRKRATDAPYGVGWSVAGVSRLYTGRSERKALLIVEPDGSFVTYDFIAAATYQAVSRAYRDTIVLGTFDPGDGSATYYRQRDIDQTESYYDAAGRLRWVIDKRGQKAEYDYSATNPYAISSIKAAPWIVGAAYAFAYTTAGNLQSITDPAGRALGVTINQTTGFLTSLLDPGLTQAVSLSYSTLGLLESWTSQRGHTFRYGYHLDQGLLRSVSTLNKADTTLFVSAQSRGLAVAGASTAAIPAPDTAKTLIDGPRPVGDTTVFYLSRWGSPLKIRNALGHTTTIDRTSSTTLEPTRIIFPNGAQKIIVYDGRGMVKSVKDTAVALPNSVTAYTYGSPQNRSLPTLIQRVGSTYTDSTRFTLNTLGLIATVTEQNGLITRFTYESGTPISGALTTIRQDSVTTYSQSLNTKLRRRLVTRLSYDTLGNIIGDENPSGSVRTYKAWVPEFESSRPHILTV
jgi:hypothetical protein